MDTDRGRLTRRQTVQLGGAAAAGSLVTRFAGPRAAPARVPLDWDVRTFAPSSANDPPHVQCVYDDINRIAVLVGDFKFPLLFGLPLGEMFESVLPRVDVGASYGLFADPDSVKDLMTAMAEAGGELTIGKLFTKRRQKLSADVREIQLDLWRQGIRLPLPATSSTTSRRRRTALDELVAANKQMTFKLFFMKPQKLLSDRAVVAINQIKLLGLLGWSDNDRCCKPKGGQQRILDACLPYSGKSCYLSDEPFSRGFCTAASDTCPSDTSGGHNH